MTRDFPPPPPDDAPIWRHMHYAACTAPGYPHAGACIAAQLLELAERILPLEPKPHPDRQQPGGTRMYFHERLARWEERQSIREAIAAVAREADLGSLTRSAPPPPTGDRIVELPEAICIDGIELPQGARVLLRSQPLFVPGDAPAALRPDKRLPDCVATWPDCYDGGYDPRCCRFPKSCSCVGP